MSNEPKVPRRRSLQEYVDLEYILLGDLRDLLEEPITEETSRWLRVVLDALVDMLPKEFRLEEEGGYMAEVLEEHPTWYREVLRLHREHDELFAKLCDLRRRIMLHQPFSEVAHLVRLELRDWMAQLTAHNRHEARLLQTAFNLEIGVGD